MQAKARRPSLSQKTAQTRVFVIVCLSVCLAMLFHCTLPAIAKLARLMESSSSGLAPRFSEVIVSVIQLAWPLCLLAYLIPKYLGRHRYSRYVLAQGALCLGGGTYTADAGEKKRECVHD